MENLVIYKVRANENNVLSFANNVDDIAPYWFLHGAVFMDDDNDRFTYLVYGESDFLTKDIVEQLNCEVLNIPITPEEIKLVHQSAVYKAIKICLNKDNIEIFGDAILNKYPEFRKSDTVEIAIIKAALAERNATFTEEDYEDF